MTTTAFDNICNLTLASDLFAQALHPTLPILTVGFSAGHVQTYKLPPAADEDEVSDSDEDEESHTQKAANGGPTPIISSVRRSSNVSENGLGSIDTIWKTKRHKGSCRALTFSHDGELCYSAGTDGLVKCFESSTGRVVSKIAVENDKMGQVDAPTVLHALSPQALIVATDSGKMHLYDLREGGKGMSDRPSQTWIPHENEHVNALVPLPISNTSTSGFPKQWVSVGGTTLAVTDVRKGVIKRSENQEVELSSVAIVQGLKKGGTSVGEKVLVGQADGVISLWEKGVWGDLDERVVVDRYMAGVETIVEVPMEWARKKLKMNEKIVAVGLEDGRIRFVRIGRNGVLPEWDMKHDEIDGVVGLGFDVDGRMVSGGGNVVKLWTEAKGQPGGGRNGTFKRPMESDDDSDDEEEDEKQEADDDDNSDSDSDGSDKGKRKKRKRNKGKDKTGGKAMEFNFS